MEYETPRLTLRTPRKEDAAAFLGYLLANRDFLAEWEPERDTSYFTKESVKAALERQLGDIEAKRGFLFLLFAKASGELIGSIGISNIVFGPFRSCNLGYRLSAGRENQGYMTEALAKIVEFCFKELSLHRIEANVMPRNAGSKRVLEKLGFEREGLGKRYLRIAGVWEDHERYAIRDE
ncbi:MAG: GNAT family N-acetyltransferase [Spirochaetaceae bacterium]|nr:GNAT family N-acetyltransferase [Spirochaetaceae bacterium]